MSPSRKRITTQVRWSSTSPGALLSQLRSWISTITRDDGEFEIYVMNADRTEQERITDWRSDRDGNGGTVPVNCTNNPADDGHSSWTVDARFPERRRRPAATACVRYGSRVKQLISRTAAASRPIGPSPARGSFRRLVQDSSIHLSSTTAGAISPLHCSGYKVLHALRPSVRVAYSPLNPLLECGKGERRRTAGVPERRPQKLPGRVSWNPSPPWRSRAESRDVLRADCLWRRRMDRLYQQ